MAEFHLAPVRVPVDVDVGHAHGERMRTILASCMPSMCDRDLVSFAWSCWIKGLFHEDPWSVSHRSRGQTIVERWSLCGG